MAVLVLDRAFLPNFVFGAEDTVVVLGQDGLVANSLKYLQEQPLIAVNPDPARWDGVLLPFEVKDVSKVVVDVFARKRTYREITMARAELNNGQKLYGVNDLFIGQKSHVSARYQISMGSREEKQSSSASLYQPAQLHRLAESVSPSARGRQCLGQPFWDRCPEGLQMGIAYLYFTVQEPFPSKSSEAGLIFGTCE
jgi:hypothetical protein